MPRVKQFSEEEVLKRATELFWKKGFNATSMQDLVDHLGINRASIYDTFGGKQELFDKAFSEYRAGNRRNIIDFLNQQESVKKGFYKLFELTVNAAISDKDCKGCLVVNTTTELLPGDQDLEDIVVENKHFFQTLFLEYLQRGVENGEIHKGKNLKAISSMFYTLYIGLQVTGKVKPSKEELINTVNIGLSVLD